MRKIFPTIILSIASIIFCSQNPTTVFASAGELTVSPPSFELTADPGDVVKEYINITNISQAGLIVSVSAENFNSTGDSNETPLKDSSPSNSIKDWIKFENNFVLKQGETKKLPFTINIPQNAQSGSHYGSILFKPNTSDTVLTKTSSLILLRVSGEINESIAVNDFQIDKSNLQTDENLSYSFQVSNDGNVYVQLGGYISVANPAKQEVKKISIPSQNVISGTKCTFRNDFPLNGPSGEYTFTLHLNYGESNKTITASSNYNFIQEKDTEKEINKNSTNKTDNSISSKQENKFLNKTDGKVAAIVVTILIFMLALSAVLLVRYLKNKTRSNNTNTSTDQDPNTQDPTCH